MVNIAVAGGSGQVAREVIDALVARNKHGITVLSRSVSGEAALLPGVHHRRVDYTDRKGLAIALQGIHTVLSFIQLLSDPGQESQKNLIDACVAAGVKRFAPSEYGSAGTVDMPWWAGKEEIRQYLHKVNERGQVLEYTLFQPGLFLDYLASPYRTAKHVAPLDTVFDFQNRRAVVVEGHENAVMTFTSVADVAAAVARAVDNEGAWPPISGIRGNQVPVSQVVAIGDKIRGPFMVDRVNIEDLEAGRLDTSWTVAKKHRAVSDEAGAGMFKTVTIGMLLSSVKGAWEVSDELNQQFPDIEFEGLEAFLTRVWAGKP